jgi:hypothetical protein
VNLEKLRQVKKMKKLLFALTISFGALSVICGVVLCGMSICAVVGKTLNFERKTKEKLRNYILSKTS